MGSATPDHRDPLPNSVQTPSLTVSVGAGSCFPDELYGSRIAKNHDLHHCDHADDNQHEELREQPQAMSSSPIASGDEERVISSVPFPTVVLVITIYFIVSLSIVYFNWWLFTSSFKFPIFVSWVQQVVGLLLFLLLGSLGTLVRPFEKFRPLKLDGSLVLKCLPLSILFVGMVGFANICLKYVLVSTYQVARSLTILFTIILSYLLLGETQTKCILFSCGIMVVGFIIGSLDGATLSFIGLGAGAASSVFQAMYNVTIKRTLVHVDNDPIKLLYFNMYASSVLFVPVIFCTEGSHVFRYVAGVSWHERHFYTMWASLALSGLLATSMNLASYWTVKATSPLTFNIVGFTKSVVQSVGGIVFFGDAYSIKSLTGIALSFAGSGWYSAAKLGFCNGPAASTASCDDDLPPGAVSGEDCGDEERLVEGGQVVMNGCSQVSRMKSSEKWQRRFYRLFARGINTNTAYTRLRNSPPAGNVGPVQHEDEHKRDFPSLMFSSPLSFAGGFPLIVRERIFPFPEVPVVPPRVELCETRT